MSALDEMGDFLSGSDSARDVENVAKSLGSAIGNVVGASIDSYEKAANGTSAGDPVSSALLARIIILKNSLSEYRKVFVNSATQHPNFLSCAAR